MADTGDRILAQLQALSEDVAALKRVSVVTGAPSVSSLELPSKPEPNLSKQANQDQFKFCTKLASHVNAALSCLTRDEDGPSWQLNHLQRDPLSTLAYELEQARDVIAQRQKLIRLADRSELGWAVVPFYLADPLAEDEDDEKRIKAACKAAAEQRLKAQKQKASGGFDFR